MLISNLLAMCPASYDVGNESKGRLIRQSFLISAGLVALPEIDPLPPASRSPSVRMRHIQTAAISIRGLIQAQIKDDRGKHASP